MYRLFYSIFTLFIVASLSAISTLARDLPFTTPEQVGLSDDRLERLDDAMQEYVDAGKISGSVALVVRRGKVAHYKAYGMSDVGKETAMQPDNLFRIASMTKAITSLAVMILYEEGKFNLNDPVSNFIPEYKDMKVLVVNEKGSSEPYTLVPAKSPITVRHLLTHTSGISYRFAGVPHVYDFFKEADISDGLHPTEGTIGEMMKKLAKMPLVSHPGEQWVYGLNTDLLGYFVEVVSGMPLDKFFEERIFRPLRMEDTYFYPPEEKLPRLAPVYQPDGNGGIEKALDEVQERGTVLYSSHYHYSGPKTYFSGGAGLASTAMDYARFLQMVLNGGELEGRRVLSRKTVELMLQDHSAGMSVPFRGPGYAFGLGFSLHLDLGASGKIGSVGEFDWGGFFNTKFWGDPKEELIGIFMNQSYPNSAPDIQEKFRVLVYQSIAD